MRPNEKLKLKNLETYAGDMMKALEEDRSGLIKKVIHEEEEREAMKKNLSPESAKNRLFFFSGLFLLGSALFLFFRFSPGTEQKEQSDLSGVGAAPVIFAERRGFLPVDGMSKNEVAPAVLESLRDPALQPGEMKILEVVEDGRVVGLRRILEIVRSGVPGNETGKMGRAVFGTFLPAISAETGSNTVGASFFLLFESGSFQDAFRFARAWEPKIFSDLSMFFPPVGGLPARTEIALTWRDEFVQNKNARALIDESGQAVLLYVFVSDRFTAVVSSETAAREIISRLSGKFSGK